MSEKKSMHDFYETQIMDVMRKGNIAAPCVDQDTSTPEVFSMLMRHEFLWVTAMDDPKRILGVITVSDALALLSPPVISLETFDKPDARSLQFGVQLTAGEIMTKKPVTASLEDTVRDVIVRMKQFKVKQLPVVDPKGLFLGDISLRQLIEKYSKEMVG